MAKRWLCIKCGTWNQLRNENAMIMIPIKGIDYCQKCGWNSTENRFIVDKYGIPF